MSAITRRGFLAMAGAAGLAALASCSPARTTTLTLGCGEPGGSYLQFGELLRDAVGTGGAIRIEPVPTQGSVDNLRLLGERRVDLALCLADSAAESDIDPVAIGRVYQNYLQCIVRRDSGIRDLADLSGRRISVGAPGSGAAATARRVLDAEPPGATAPVTVELPIRQATQELQARSIDALFWSGGVPTPQIRELSNCTPIAVLDITPVLSALTARYPGEYAATVVPDGVYGAERAVPTIGVANLLLTHPDLPADQARSLVDVLIDDATTLVPPDALGVQYLTPASLIDTVPVALHPAAAERFRERYR